MSGKKMGRPTDNPLTVRIGVRLDPKTINMLDEYCKANNLRKSEGVRQAIIQYISK